MRLRAGEGVRPRSHVTNARSLTALAPDAAPLGLRGAGDAPAVGQATRNYPIEPNESKSMSKKELITGAIIVMILSLLLIGNLGDIARNEEYLPPPIISDTRTISIVGWAATLYVIGFMIVATWAMTKTGSPFEQVSKRYTVRAVIPGYFFLVLIPYVFGIVFVLALRQTTWGLWLSCVGVPATIIFLIIALRKQAGS